MIAKSLVQRSLRLSVWRSDQPVCHLQLLMLPCVNLFLCYTGSKINVDQVSRDINEPNLQDLITTFVSEQVDRNSIFFDYAPTPNGANESLTFPRFSQPISTFPSAVVMFHAPSDICGTGGMRAERICAISTWQGTSGRYDCVLIRRSSTQLDDLCGFQRYSIGHICLFFYIYIPWYGLLLCSGPQLFTSQWGARSEYWDVGCVTCYFEMLSMCLSYPTAFHSVCSTSNTSLWIWGDNVTENMHPRNLSWWLWVLLHEQVCWSSCIRDCFLRCFSCHFSFFQGEFGELPRNSIFFQNIWQRWILAIPWAAPLALSLFNLPLCILLVHLCSTWNWVCLVLVFLFFFEWLGSLLVGPLYYLNSFTYLAFVLRSSSFFFGNLRVLWSHFTDWF